MTGAVKLNTAGGGSVVVQPASSIASDVTVNVPSVNGTLVSTGSTAQVSPAMLSTGAPSWDSSGNLSFNSGYGSVATAYGCRAWVNFNGTGTVAIRSSGNVSSITDNGTADYTVNFTNALADANYATVATNNVNTYTAIKPATTPSTTSVTFNIGGTGDASIMNVAIFR